MREGEGEGLPGGEIIGFLGEERLDFFHILFEDLFGGGSLGGGAMKEAGGEGGEVVRDG